MERNDFFKKAQPVTLEQVLDAREQRAVNQRQLLEKFQRPLISYTLNIPGEYKAFPLARQTFAEGGLLITRQLARAGYEILYYQEAGSAAGYEGYYVVDADAAKMKALMVAVEDGHPLGRLLDIDVFCGDGVALRGEAYGREERKCLICGGPVWSCSRSRTHSAKELALNAAQRMEDYFHGKYADKIAFYAQKALLYEVSVTPKPGLVDRANNGAHADMDMFTFIDSTCVLTPYFRDCTLRGLTFHGELEALFSALRYPGMCAEDAMFAATGGVNTHKGLIFSLGLICAAMGFLQKSGEDINTDSLLKVCGCMAACALDELQDGGSNTHGVKVFQKYGLTGIRGEAADGFPHARKYGLPILREMARSGYSLNDAGVAVLLHLIAHVEDTNIIHRSDKSVQQDISGAVYAFLKTNPTPAQLLEEARNLDEEYIRRNISPGGCADILAISLMLFFCFPN